MLGIILSWFENRINTYPEATPKLMSDKSVMAFIWCNLEGTRLWFLIMVIFSAGMAIFSALLFQVMGWVVDWLGKYTPENFWREKGIYLLVILAVIIFSTLWSFIGSAIRLQTLQGAFPMRLRWNFHRLMLNQSLSFYQNEFAGRVSAKVMQTALAVRDTAITIADIVVYAIVYFISVSAILITIDAWMLIPFAVWLVLLVTLMWRVTPKLAETAKQQADARSLMTGRITDAYSNISTVKLFSHGAREAAYAKQSMREFMVTVNMQMRIATTLDSLSHFINMLLTCSTAALGIYLWHQGAVGVGAVATAIAMALRFNSMSQWIMWECARLFENIGTVQDGMNTLSKKQTILDHPQAKALRITQGAIAFNHVNFSYEANHPLFSDFNLDIKPGEKVGLVSRSGSGKSTLVNLLLRFYDVNSGKICIDGQDINSVTQESLRSQIGLVTQDTSLLHRSVRDNINYGRPNATDDEMMQAAKLAKADEFIAYLSDIKGRNGYDAHVGERGVKLSGGQRQRIAIARVMLKNAPILILDEATSALDSEVESAIQESLNQLMENKTVIAIAHRLSTIVAMDRLIVLDKGKIVEEGSHEMLLQKNGLYAKFWAHQSGGFLGNQLPE